MANASYNAISKVEIYALLWARGHVDGSPQHFIHRLNANGKYISHAFLIEWKVGNYVFASRIVKRQSGQSIPGDTSKIETLIGRR